MELIQKGFKQTEVGLIPIDWEAKKIDDLTKLSAGGTPSTKIQNYWNGEIPWMNSGELNLKQVFNVENRITELGLKNSSTKIIPKYCILIGLAGQGKTRGTAALNHIELCTNQSIAAIYPSNQFDSTYLYYFIDSQYDELRKLSTGDGGRGGLNLTIIRNIKIPLPPTLNEQQAIATALSDVDALISSLDELISKKKAIKQGAMQQLLTPPSKGGKRLPGFDGEWEEKKLGEVLNFGSGQDYKKLSKGDIPVYGTGGIMTYVDDYLYDGESVGIGRKGTIDKPIFLNGKFWTVDTLFYTHSFVLTIPKFIYYKFLLIQWKEYNEASGVPSLNKNTLSKIQIYLPSTLKEQKAIAEILSDMDAELEQLEAKKEKYQQIKQGMMQELLTGKTRLV